MPPENERAIESSKSLPAASEEAAQLNALDILRKTSSSSVKVLTPPDAQGEYSVGSGIMVSSGDAVCEFATASHVNASHDQLKVIAQNGRSYEAQLVRNDLKNELSVFRIPEMPALSSECRPLEVSARQLRPGENVLGLSSAEDPRWPVPYIGQFLQSVSRDNQVYVRRLPTMIGEDMLRPMDAFMMRGDHGDSGGGLIDAYGKIVGIEAAAANGYSLSERGEKLLALLAQIKAERQNK